jgi:hypothetical protein
MFLPHAMELLSSSFNLCPGRGAPRGLLSMTWHVLDQLTLQNWDVLPANQNKVSSRSCHDYLSHSHQSELLALKLSGCCFRQLWKTDSNVQGNILTICQRKRGCFVSTGHLQFARQLCLRSQLNLIFTRAPVCIMSQILGCRWLSLSWLWTFHHNLRGK